MNSLVRIDGAWTNQGNRIISRTGPNDIVTQPSHGLQHCSTSFAGSFLSIGLGGQRLRRMRASLIHTNISCLDPSSHPSCRHHSSAGPEREGASRIPNSKLPSDCSIHNPLYALQVTASQKRALAPTLQYISEPTLCRFDKQRNAVMCPDKQEYHHKRY
ncbi:hypothetical protein LZ30DRAFT_479015 [Colletotrichum cereale]|nr:hypothetical protein LZ30DRAFT_479015 [Colletotrichum cereale]